MTGRRSRRFPSPRFWLAAARSAKEALRSQGSVVVDRVRNEKGGYGFNAATEEYGDLIKAGVIDPTKVVRCALQNAASVAGLLLTTEAMIADKPEKKKAGGMPGMGDMDMLSARKSRLTTHGLRRLTPPGPVSFSPHDCPAVIRFEG